MGLTDDARVAEAVAARAEQRVRQQRAVESATFAGTLRDLAERRTGATLVTRSGRRYQGTIVTTALDHIGLTTAAGDLLLVATAATALVRPDGAPAAQGERNPAHDLLLLEQCARWAADRPVVAVATEGADALVRGRLVAVGEDVVTVVTDADRTPVYVAGAAIEAIARIPGPAADDHVGS